MVVLPSDDSDVLLLKPLGGSDEEITGIFQPLLLRKTNLPKRYFQIQRKKTLAHFRPHVAAGILTARVPQRRWPVPLSRKTFLSPARLPDDPAHHVTAA